MNVIWDVLQALVLPPASAWFWGTVFRPWVKPRILAAWAAAAVVGLAGGLLSSDWPWAAGSAASLAVVLAVWWRRRRKRRRTLAILGAKPEALIAALVKRMRTGRRPSRVLQPGLVPS
jgi:membrane protein implicated in regulation of membrane protease activity